MSAFLDQAKEVLNNEQATRLEMLNLKSHNFDTTSDEDEELMALKKEVKKLVADRDRNKNLSFLKEGAYSIKDVLASMGADHQAVIKDSGLSIADIFKLMAITKKQAMSAIKEVYVTGAKPANDTFPALATIGSEDIVMGRNSRDNNKLVIAMGAKGLVENLTDQAKVWIRENYVSAKGPYVGQTIYPNVNKVAQKFKFQPKDIMIALGLIEEEKKEEKKEPKAAAKKAEDKKAA